MVQHKFFGALFSLQDRQNLTGRLDSLAITSFLVPFASVLTMFCKAAISEVSTTLMGVAITTGAAAAGLRGRWPLAAFFIRSRNRALFSPSWPASSRMKQGNAQTSTRITADLLTIWVQATSRSRGKPADLCAPIITPPLSSMNRCRSWLPSRGCHKAHVDGIGLIVARYVSCVSLFDARHFPASLRTWRRVNPLCASAKKPAMDSGKVRTRKASVAKPVASGFGT